MTLRIIVAALHLLGLGIGMGAVFVRSRALGSKRVRERLDSALLADNLWGVAALIWIATGLWRAFGDLEKGAEYYLGNSFFIAKMGAFVLIFLLELMPMVTLIRWRIDGRQGADVDLGKARTIALIGYVQLVILLVMTVLATGMARGIGM